MMDYVRFLHLEDELFREVDDLYGLFCYAFSTYSPLAYYPTGRQLATAIEWLIKYKPVYKKFGEVAFREKCLRPYVEKFIDKNFASRETR